MIIHLSDYASQPDIRIKCDQSWTTPKWPDGGNSGIKNVWYADDNRLYTFNKELVTCEQCKMK